jgi:hypothetical protein
MLGSNPCKKTTWKIRSTRELAFQVHSVSVKHKRHEFTVPFTFFITPALFYSQSSLILVWVASRLFASLPCKWNPAKFWALLMRRSIYVLGCAAVLATSFERPLRAGYGLPGLIVAMVLVGFGGGGLKMLMVPFLGETCISYLACIFDHPANAASADQYPEDQPRMKTLKSGEKVVTDRSLTLQYIYNLYYWYGCLHSNHMTRMLT